MVEVWLPYGKAEVCLRVPTENFLGIIKPNEMKGAENPQEEIERSLKEPIGTKRLPEIVKPGDKISIVINDAGDCSLNLLIVKSILIELNEAGASNRDITVIKGYNPLYTSAAKNDVEFRNDEALKEVEVIDHNCESQENVYVGETSFGTKVHLNKRFVESKTKILAGQVRPHPYMGYSGGRDGVLCGVSSVETIQHNLSMVTHPKARSGLLEGNPVHEDVVEAAHLIGVDFTLNAVRNKDQELVKCFAGDLDEAFNKGVNLADEMYKIPVGGRADIVFASPGGFPFDLSLHESCKGIRNALEVIRKNGVLILVAECSGGYGSSDFYNLMAKYKDLKGIENSLKKRFTANGYVAYSLTGARERVEMILVSTIPDFYALEVFKLKTARTVNDALRYAFDSSKKNAKIFAISHGNITIPVVKQ